MGRRRNWVDWLIVAALIAVGCVRIVATYSTLNQTYDEGAHLACGMEWVSKGVYTLEMLHPPLARAMIATGPYLHGARSHNVGEIWDEGTAVLFDHNDYWRNLSLARLGTLPFYALACVAVFLWGRRWFGRGTALLATLIFSTLPPVLAHSGLATLDAGCCATVALAAYCLMTWIEEPTIRRAVALGVSIAAAVLTKYSSFVYLPACAIAMTAAWLATAKPGLRVVRERATYFAPRLAVVLTLSLFLIWGGFRFSVQPLSAGTQFHKIAEEMPKISRIASVPLPLTEVAIGLAQLSHHNGRGVDAYLLGRYSKRGWWYFFPVVLLVKAPLGMLVLAAIGTILAVRRTAGLASAPQLATLLCAIAIMLVAMSSGINLGGRHILPIYPFLTAIAARAAIWMCTGGRPRWAAALAVLLLAGDLLHTSAAGIDQLTYFNPLAGRHPEKILAESDLDWGQDLHRLAVRVKELGIPKLSIAYFGTLPLEAAGLPPFTGIDGATPVTGYVAVSVRNLTLVAARDGTFGWLRGARPIERVGGTIYLYHLPEPH